ncbi:MAG: aminotransferase class I/II-fold pyridoxal phosphate-dependent enzyme, partial [Duodenibacillus sp.]|nr:aminotransferase class I/II-fold pyridoxal phosphate-dependent enzyme [Duodenibacillus sp.]
MNRYDNIRPFIVMDIVREAAKFDDSIHFEIGQPDLPPSPAVREALLAAVAENRFSYTESRGLPALRELISALYRKNYGVDVAPERILLTPGTSGAFLIAYGLTLPPGGTLGLTDPSYPCYENFATFLNARTKLFPVGPEETYQLRPEQLRGSAIDALQISSPANPTGNIYTPRRMSELIAACRDESIAFISDELYHGLVYGEPAATALKFSGDAYVINGFSKYFCMPGQRLGWIIVPADKVRPAEILAENLFISAPTLSQYGALKAFDEKYLEQTRQEFERRRDFLYEELKTLFTVEFKPQGAFY